MSIPIQTTDPASSGRAAGAGPTSPVIGTVSFGWISESWRLFSAQIGLWIIATLLLLVPVFVLVIAFYAIMWTTLFPHGFTPPPPPPVGVNGLPTAPPAPGPSQAQMNATLLKLIPWEFGLMAVYSLWSAFLYGGMLRLAVRQVRGVPVEIKDLFRGGPLFGRMLGATLLLGLGAYALEAICFGPMLLVTWRHGSGLWTALSLGIGFLAYFALTLLAAGLLLPAFALMADGVRLFPALRRSMVSMKGQTLPAAGFVFVQGIVFYAGQLLCGVGLLATLPMTVLVSALAYRDMAGMPDMAPLPGPVYAPAGVGVWPPPPSLPVFPTAFPSHSVVPSDRVSPDERT